MNSSTSAGRIHASTGRTMILRHARRIIAALTRRNADRRHGAASLARLGDHVLGDIGITRTEVLYLAVNPGRESGRTLNNDRSGRPRVARIAAG